MNIFHVTDLVPTVLKYLTVVDLGKVCKTSRTNYKTTQSYYRRKKSHIFRVQYNDVRMDIAAYNSMRCIFQRIPRQSKTLSEAVAYLYSKQVYNDDKGRWVHIVDEWNAYYTPGKKRLRH